MDEPEKLSIEEMKRIGFALCDSSVEQPVAASLYAEARRARRSEASLTAALSALRAEHQRVVAERDELLLSGKAWENTATSLREQRDELTRYIDEAKKACGDDRVTGEPLAQVIASLRSLKDSELAGAMCEVLHSFALYEGEVDETPVATLTRICEQRDALKGQLAEAQRSCRTFAQNADTLAAQLAEAQRDRSFDVELAEAIAVIGERDQLRAALAASEEKAREMWQALSNLVALAEMSDDFNNPGEEPDCYAAMHHAKAALSSPSAGPASEEPKR